MLTLIQIKKLKELKKKYGYELAIESDQMPSDDSELLDVLVLAEADENISSAINSTICNSSDDISALFTVVILLAKNYSKTLDIFKEKGYDVAYLEKVFEKHKNEYKDKS